MIYKKKVFVALDNIRSAQNVGSIFRTADACGISKLFLIGCTATPLDRFGRERNDIKKTSLGAEKNISWKYFSDTEQFFKKVNEEKILLISVEQNKKSIDYKKFNLSDHEEKSVVFVFGNEVNGVSDKILKKTNQIIEIPMLGKKESLNVAVSAGVVLFRVLGI